MSERNLSRRVASSVVDALKAQGHVLVVKGGSEALVRQLAGLMEEELTQVSAGVGPRAVVGEVTSTFGDEAIDEAIEEMVGKLAKALMDSDHVEDVFAEDNVIRRDIFRAVRDTLLAGAGVSDNDADEDVAGPISVRLDTLGYVASTVAKRADSETLRDALERAALAAEGQLAAYDAENREALFTVTAGDPDGRLELEEAVADELSDLVDMGLVELPRIERRIELPREVSPTERPQLKSRVDALAARTLMRAGCAATWELVSPRSIKLTFTPLSEQDAKTVDQHTATFGRALATLMSEAPTSDCAPASVPMPSARPPAPSERSAREEAASAAPSGEEEGTAIRAKPTKRPSAKRTKTAVRKVSAKSKPPAPSTSSKPPTSVKTSAASKAASSTKAPPSKGSGAKRLSSAPKTRKKA